MKMIFLKFQLKKTVIAHNINTSVFNCVLCSFFELK